MDDLALLSDVYFHLTAVLTGGFCFILQAPQQFHFASPLQRRQWGDLSERRPDWRRERRGPAVRTRRVDSQPRIDALRMEVMPTIRQQPQHVGLLVLRQADRAAAGVRGQAAAAAASGLRLRVKELWEAPQRGLVEAERNPDRVAAVLGLGEGVAMGWRVADAGAEVGREGEEDDEGEDAEGDPDAVREPSRVLPGGQVIGGAVHVTGGSIDRRSHQRGLKTGRERERENVEACVVVVRETSMRGR